MIPKRSRPSAPAPAVCPAECALRHISGKWKVPIVWHLLSGTRRFGELRRCLPGVTPRMLIRQLRELESDGLLRRKVWPQIPPRVDYTLTPKGRSLRAIIAAMSNWSRSRKSAAEK